MLSLVVIFVSGNLLGETPVEFRRIRLIESPLAEIFFGAAGCTKDTDCKGDRICEKGVCIAPAPLPLPQVVPDAGALTLTEPQIIDLYVEGRLKEARSEAQRAGLNEMADKFAAIDEAWNAAIVLRTEKLFAAAIAKYEEVIEIDRAVTLRESQARKGAREVLSQLYTLKALSEPADSRAASVKKAQELDPSNAAAQQLSQPKPSLPTDAPVAAATPKFESSAALLNSLHLERVDLLAHRPSIGGPMTWFVISMHLLIGGGLTALFANAAVGGIIAGVGGIPFLISLPILIGRGVERSHIDKRLEAIDRAILKIRQGDLPSTTAPPEKKTRKCADGYLWDGNGCAWARVGEADRPDAQPTASLVAPAPPLVSAPQKKEVADRPSEQAGQIGLRLGAQAVVGAHLPWPAFAVGGSAQIAFQKSFLAIYLDIGGVGSAGPSTSNHFVASLMFEGLVRDLVYFAVGAGFGIGQRAVDLRYYSPPQPAQFIVDDAKPVVDLRAGVRVARGDWGAVRLGVDVPTIFHPLANAVVSPAGYVITAPFFVTVSPMLSVGYESPVWY